jgi:hypothetical protein
MLGPALPAGFLSHAVHGLRQPFSREPDFGVTRVNHDFAGSRAAETPQRLRHPTSNSHFDPFPSTHWGYETGNPNSLWVTVPK